jgi:hypothetical protein
MPKRPSARSAYTTEPGFDPEDGTPVINIRSQMTGGHIVTSRDTQREADAECDRLAAMWDALR